MSTRRQTGKRAKRTEKKANAACEHKSVARSKRKESKADQANTQIEHRQGREQATIKMKKENNALKPHKVAQRRRRGTCRKEEGRRRI